MEEYNQFCGNCGKPKGDGYCPHCGFNDDAQLQQPPAYQQPPQTPPQPPYYGQMPKKNYEKSSVGIIVAVVISVCILAVASVIVASMLIPDDSGNNDGNPSVTEAVELTPAPTEPPVPVFPKVDVSSTRSTDYTSGAPVNYYPSYAIDGDFMTAWSADRNVSLTPSITLRADARQYVTGIRMTNGYCKTEATYTRNRRITKALIEYEGGSQTMDFGINEYRTMFDIRFPQPVETSYIRITVLETYYGDWKDIAISEIEAY